MLHVDTCANGSTGLSPGSFSWTFLVRWKRLVVWDKWGRGKCNLLAAGSSVWCCWQEWISWFKGRQSPQESFSHKLYVNGVVISKSGWHGELPVTVLSWHFCVFRCIIWICVCFHCSLVPQAAVWAGAPLLSVGCGSYVASLLRAKEEKCSHFTVYC